MDKNVILSLTVCWVCREGNDESLSLTIIPTLTLPKGGNSDTFFDILPHTYRFT